MSEKQVETGGARSTGGRLPLGRLVPVALLVAGLIAFFALGLHRYVTPDALKEHRVSLKMWVDNYGIWSLVVFGAVYVVVAALSIPGGALLTITGGFLFGPYHATITVLIGATLGGTALFLAARFALADFLRAKAGPYLQKIENGFNENGMNYMLILRLVPLFPFWLVNLAPAFLGVPLRTFVISTFFGIIPGTVVYALVGDGAGAVFDQGGEIDLWIIFEPRILAPIIGLIVLALIPVIYKWWRTRMAVNNGGPHG